MIQKTNFSFHVKTESVTLIIPKKTERCGDQYVSFNCYALQNRKKFNNFKEVIVNSKPEEYDSISDVYGLAREFEIRPMAGSKPTITDRIAF